MLGPHVIKCRVKCDGTCIGGVEEVVAVVVVMSLVNIALRAIDVRHLKPLAMLIKSTGSCIALFCLFDV